MFRKRKFLRFIALFFALEMLIDITLPGISYALTSGPTAPESSSFEPVDTSELVNMLTGDFTYNMPLIEVPGPGGGYPLSLSYHAGILPGEEASWTGLGWTLNPGAISRTVSGYPDDFNGLDGVDHEFWEGGESTIKALGLSMSVYGYGNVHGQLQKSQDTYKGSNTFRDAGFRLNTWMLEVNDKSEVVGIQMPVSGIPLASVTASYRPGEGLQGDITPNFPTTGASLASFGVSKLSNGIVQGSFTKKSSNSKSGNLNTKSKSSGFNVSFWGIGIQAQKTYQRYWIDETSTSSLFGSMYSPKKSIPDTELLSKSFDNYDLPAQSTEFTSKESPVNQMGGSFPDYDHYSVNAQGIGGSMRPYHFYDYLYRQTEMHDGKVQSKTYALGTSDKQAHFRFAGDFSNKLKYSDEGFNMVDPFNFSVNASDIKTGLNGNDGYTNNQLAGSKHVRFFTNKQINETTLPKVNGLIDCVAPGFDRTKLPAETAEQVGAFLVTNESGVNYHFALPVYSSTEYSYNGRKDIADKQWANQYKREGSYAYTWYLTAVTGPDYVDKNNNGLADAGDYGYWVNLEYGKWADNYVWRNPSEGFHKDIDQEWETAHKGKKELYYLNSIKTATHTAIFVKEIRLDGKSVTTAKDELITIENRQVTFKDNGGFAPTSKKFYEGAEGRENTYMRHASSTLKLNEIYLFKNENFKFDNLASTSDNYDHVFVYDYIGPIGNAAKYKDRYHYGKNVIDVHDIAGILGDVKDASLRSIVLNSDYSLAPATKNSFSPFASQPRGEFNGLLSDKLTLKSIITRGKRGAEVMPPTTFKYELDNPDGGSLRFTDGSDILLDVDGQLEEGDILKFEKGNFTHYVTILQRQGSTSNYKFRLIHSNYLTNDKGIFPTGFFDGATTVDVTATKTKNPPYHEDMRDIWGFYKSDFDWRSASENYNFLRRTSEVSAKSTDVWSLRAINNGLGATVRINYEPDYYDKAVLGGKQAFRVKDITKVSANQLKVELFDEGFDTERWLDVNQKIFFSGLATYIIHEHIGGCYGCGFQPNFTHTEVINGALDNVQIDVANNTITGTVNTGVMDMFARTEFTAPGDPGGDEDCLNSHCSYEVADAWPDYISGGLVYLTETGQFGGGVRVSGITVEDGTSQRTTKYIYKEGKTSYEPLGIYRPLLNPVYLDAVDDFANFSKAVNEVGLKYKQAAMQYTSRLIHLAREIPGPEVLYAKVEVREEVNEGGLGWNPAEQYTEYQFNTYEIEEEGDVGIGVRQIDVADQVDPVNMGGIEHKQLFRDGLMIEDKTARIGTLHKVSLFNSNNPVSETSYDYNITNDSELYKSQGVVQELFADARYVRQDEETDIYYLRGMLSGRTYLPYIQTATTAINHKTGMKGTTKTLGFDFYSGATTKTVSSDSYGNYFMSEAIPAYHKYPGMGLALNGGDNMLTQGTAEYMWAINNETDQEKTGLISAGVQVWSDQVKELEATASGAWRKKAKYNWNGELPLNADGTYDKADFLTNDFDWNNLSGNQKWEKMNEITLYDGFSHGLEALDVNGDYVSTRMDPEQYKVIANAANTRYHEMAYSGAEYYSSTTYDEGGVSRGQGVATIARSHTGRYSLLVKTGQSGFTYTLKPATADLTKPYFASVWVYLPGVTEDSQISEADLYYRVNGQEVSVSPTQGKNKSKSWYRLELVVEPDGNNSIEIGCRNGATRGIYFDDFRVCPLSAAMTTYVYDQETDELTDILDVDNLYTHFEYDAMGRLIRTTREHMNFDDERSSVRPDQVMNEIIYNYGNN